MIRKLDISFGIILISIAIGLNLSPLLMTKVGGSWILLILAAAGVLIAKYKFQDIPFKQALERGVAANGGMMICLLIYYVMVTIAAIRWEFAWETESHIIKSHFMNLMGLVMGLFFICNIRFTRLAAYISVFFLLYSTYWLNKYVDMTGESARTALTEWEGALGTTSNWQVFGMQIVLILGLLLDEKNRIIKIIGVLVLLLLYRTILLCGFATPIALLIIAHGVLGIIFVFYAKASRFSMLLKLVIPVVLTGGAMFAFYAIGKFDERDKKYSDIQYRFKNVRMDWRGGGYDYSTGQSRLELSLLSIELFKKAPIFGVGGVYATTDKHLTGGHQSLFDFFAMYGVVGGGAYLLFVILCLKNVIMRYRREQSWFAASQIGATVMFAVGGFVNPCWVGMPVTILFCYGQPFKLHPSFETKRRLKGEVIIGRGK